MSRSVIAELPRLPWLSAAIARAGLLPTLRRKVVRHAVTATTLALMLLLLVSAMRDFAEVRAGLERETRLLADSLAVTLATRDVAGGPGALAALMAPAAGQAHLAGASLHDRDGQLLALSGHPRSGSHWLAPLFGDTLVVRPLNHGGQPWGELRLAISPAYLMALFLKEVLLSLFALVLAVAIAALLLYRGLSRFSERLHDMSSTMSAISASGNFALRIAEPDRDDVREVSVLMRSLNALLDEVQGHSFNLECELENSRLTDLHLGKLSVAVENSAAGIFIADADGWIEYANLHYRKMLDIGQSDCLGLPSPLVRSQHVPEEVYASMWESLRNDAHWRGEVCLRRHGGESVWSMLALSAICNEDGAITQVVGNLEDISERKRAEETINRLAFYDTLTQLPNRHSFGEQLPRLLARANRRREMVAICYLDLDRFKEVNDSLGHSMGDNLLKTAARRLQSVLREHDVVARLGGDEFALIIPGLHDCSGAEVVASKIIEHMTRPFRLDGRELSVTASMGMVFYPEHGTDADELLKKADIALYRAKGLGRNNFQVFSPGLEEVGLARRELEAQIRQSLVTEDFCLEYQPKLDLRSGRLCGAEALVRWNHPVLGFLSPDKFIPLAEESRLIIPLGNWIIGEVVRQQAAWRDAGLMSVPVAINLSTLQFKNDDLPLRFSEALLRHDIDARMIELEITESLLMDDPEHMRRQLAELDAMGIGIAIDDFGTGYSSLSYLRTLPVDVLKIDRSFVRDIETADDRITQAIIAMAKSLDLKVVAEGAETQSQIARLQALGCDEIQGYAYSRPLPPDAFAHLLAAAEDEDEVATLADD